jgi:hypothetical protein
LASDGERDDALFVNLVMIFQGAAMQQMGKIASPLTGKVERNLEQARFSIDTLAMLREKTRGNLSDDLARLLDSTLLNLRMNYVEEASAETRAGEAKAGAAAAESEGTKPEAARPETSETAEATGSGRSAGDEPGGHTEAQAEVEGARGARFGEACGDSGPRGGSKTKRRGRARAGGK